jgi:hypothetical protein
MTEMGCFHAAARLFLELRVFPVNKVTVEICDKNGLLAKADSSTAPTAVSE